MVDKPAVAAAADKPEAFENVRVAVRVRPHTPKEKLEKSASCLRVHGAERQIVVGKDRAFTFDFVFNEQATQTGVYSEACAPLVASCMNGYNATVFAYGQTGSGKTYTMGSGDEGAAGSEADGAADAERRGVIPRVVDDLFDALAAQSDTVDSIVRVSYLEIYNEEVKDLLHPRTPSKSITIREDAAGGIFVLGVHERVVHTREGLFAALAAGSTARATGATLINAVSSRSHSLFSLIVEQRPRTAGAERTCAKLNLVDLAGSERAKKTGAEGARFKESVTINQGLLALGNVIAALCDETGARARKHGRKDSLRGHVPYRESKLTRLLQDSLGGNTQTLMVACVGPAADNMDESLNTLRYADRARRIANKPVQNIEAPSNAELKDEIAALQQQLQQQAGIRFGGTPGRPLQALASPGSGAGARLPLEAAAHEAVPLSRAVLLALRSELQPAQFRRLLETLRSADASDSGAEVSPLASPAISPMASPARATGAAGESSARRQAPAPLQGLRHTMQQWGRAEAQRAHLLQRLATSGALREPDADAVGSDAAAPARSDLTALQRAVERAQLLQTLGMQQLSDLEVEVAEGAAAAAGSRGGSLSPVLEKPSSPPLANGGAGGRPSSAPHDLGASGEGSVDGTGGAASEVRRLRVALAERDAAHAATQAELTEARADLARDETIFAEKLQELRGLKRSHGALQRECDRLRNAASSTSALPAHANGEVVPIVDEDGEGAAGGGASLTPPSAASTRSLPSPHPSTGDTPPSRASDASAGAAASGAFAFSPERTFADELEANDDVLCDEASPPAAAATASPLAADGVAAGEVAAAVAAIAKGGGEAEIAALQRSIRELNAAKEMLQTNQRELSSQVHQAAAASDAETMDFEAQQQKLSSSVRDLTLNIRIKEELIRELTRADEESRNVVTSYQHKLREMSDRIASLQSQLQETKSEMEIAERQAGKSEEQKARLRAEYERRLRETEGQLQEMRKRQREQERALRSREAAERKLVELRGEVDRMRGQQSSLKEAMKSSQNKYESARHERERELSTLRKQSEESSKRVRKLEEANARQQQQLQRHAEASRLRRAERPANGVANGSRRVPATPSSRHRGHAPPVPSPPTNQHGGGGGGGGASKQEEAEAREAAAALEAEEEALLRRKGAAEALASELARREEVLAEREAVVQQRESLQLKQLRSSLSLRHSIDGLSEQMHQIDSRIDAQRSAVSAVEGGGEAVLTQLLHERRAAHERLAELEALGAAGGAELLDAAAQSELRELEERLEDLTAQLEWKNSSISELRESISRLGGGEAGAAAGPTGREGADAVGGGGGGEGGASDAQSAALASQIANMSLPVARRVLQAEAHRVVELRQAQREATARREAAELAERERAAEVHRLQAALRAAASVHEQQMREAHEAHEAQHATLEHQQMQLHEQINALQRAKPSPAPSSPPARPPAASSSHDASPAGGYSSGAPTPDEGPGGTRASQHLTQLLSAGGAPSREALEAVGKDLFYYKQSSKELRRRLKEEKAAADEARRQLEQSNARVAHDEQVQAKLQDELANLRAYLAAHPGATPTRVTKAALKEITAADVANNGQPPRAAWPVPDRPFEMDDAPSPRA